MTDKKTPPDWVLIEAAKRSERIGTKLEVILAHWFSDPTVRALCDMIERYEQPPVDRKLLCAREAYGSDDGTLDDCEAIETAIRAIELWEEGFGK
jgi:hypothetical protein